MSGMPGGFKAPLEAGPEEQEVLDKVKAAVEVQVGKSYSIFKAISYTTQVVAGTNYLFKVHAGGDEYLHVKVHKPLPHTNKEPDLMTCSISSADADLLP